MSTIVRVSYTDRKGFLTHEWFPTAFTANDRVNELHTLGMEDIDYEDVEVPWDHLADLIHWLNHNPNSPNLMRGVEPALKDSPHNMRTPTTDHISANFAAQAAMAHPRPNGTISRPAGIPSAPTEADPNGIDAHHPGAKLDAGKNRVWLCVSGFARALNTVSQVTTKGAEKYTANGWVHVDNGQERYMDAFGRHMMALGSGEIVDPDTGCMHKAQMIWNLLASLELELRSAAAWDQKESP